MFPCIEYIGAEWTAEIFETTAASERILIIRDTGQLGIYRPAGRRLKNAVTCIIDYDGADPAEETFHAKTMLADGLAAYVGLRELASMNQGDKPRMRHVD